ncbi:hypothetical protein QAD02_023971 [Eretmocerus hayati]|uniref:Uncharacterized protein n=1 Tax=Eretmocerus hayati TaxID=131215 RepID=A0ACC2PXB3_9HYME|nr:hypothetical protein QAD02_023971 [Eretmocerus hayati]
MPPYKITYFRGRALAEPIRLVLSYGGVEFEDDPFDPEDWPKVKPTTPFGTVPLLDMDGKIVRQSNAICRYFAKQFGLTGKDDLEALEVDATVDTIHDLREKLAKYHYETNEEAKAEKLELIKELVPFYIERFDEQVKENGGYFVGGDVTWADLYFFGILDYLSFMAQRDIIEDAENLKALKEKVFEIPSIKAWVEKRPDAFA